jgi:hypothetical protein
LLGWFSLQWQAPSTYLFFPRKMQA